MDRDAVGDIFATMSNLQETEVFDIPESYSSDGITESAELESYKDAKAVWFQITSFLKALETNRKKIEESEARCLHITNELAKAKLTIFLDHLYYYISRQPAHEFCSTDTQNIIIIYEGSVLSTAGQALAQALVSGCAVVLLTYENFSSTAKLLTKLWTEAKLPVGRFQVRTDFPRSLLSEKLSLKLFIGGQPVYAQNYAKFLPYFFNGHTVPLLILDGADVQSTVSVVYEKAHLLRHVDAWALSVILVEESQLAKFKTLLLERCMSAKKPAPAIQEKQLENIRKFHQENAAAEIYYLTDYRYVVLGLQPSRANRLWHHDLNGCPLYVLPVRSASEAVSKANHYGSGYAAAVYTEDGSLSQWVAEKLRASTVWINTFGQLHPAAPLPFQVVKTNDAGFCTLNNYHASANISDLLNFGKNLDVNVEEVSASQSPSPFSQEVVDKVKSAVAAQPGWEGLGGIGRSKIFLKNFISCEQRIEFKTTLTNLLKYTTVSFESSYTNQENGTAITTHVTPCGVVALYVDSTSKENSNKKLTDPELVRKSCEDVVQDIQGAIAYGNTCVVVLADDRDYTLIDLIYGESSKIPKGVVNVIKSKDVSHWLSLVQHMDVKCLWHTGSALKIEQGVLQNFEAKHAKRVWIGINKWSKNVYERNLTFSLKMYEPHATEKKHVWRKSQPN